MTTVTVTLTARELSILQSGLHELTNYIMPLDKELDSKLQEALDSIPNKKYLRWCCLNSSDPKEASHA